MLVLLYVNGFRVLFLLTIIAAMVWGGRTERGVAVLFVAVWAASQALRAMADTRYLGFETGQLIIDMIMLIGLLIVTLRSGHWWLICATSFQAVGVLGHLAKLVNPVMSRMAYALMANISIYPAVIALAVGIWQHRRRVTGGGVGRY
jgi:hypothetical protein